MPGKPITISQSEYEVLLQAKNAYAQSKEESPDWGRFLLFLLGLYILKEVAKPEDKENREVM
ncbi:hypothetical protein ACFLWD_00770 [Chloroflexota bacterium]